MEKRDIKNIFLLALVVVYVVFYRLFIFNNYNGIIDTVTAGFLIVLFVVSILLFGFRKDKYTILKADLFKMVLIYLVIAFLVMYGLGFYFGFLSNSYSLEFWAILDNVVPTLLIIIFTELLRYNFLRSNSDRKSVQIIGVVAFTLFELFINIRALPFDNLEKLFSILATIIIPVTVKNIVMSYVSLNYGYKIPIFYRIIMEIYIFIVPIVPDLGEFVNSIISIMLPAFIYMSAASFMDEKLYGKEKIFLWQ